jgi:CRP-like cAMP-binding protein
VPEKDQAARIAREVFLATFLRDTRGLGWATQRVAEQMRDMDVPGGHVIFRAGEPSEHQYFVVSGEVSMTAPGLPAWTFRDRAIVGTTDLVLERLHTRTATATAPTHLLELSGSALFSLLEDSFEFARRLVHGFAFGLLSLRQRPQPLGGFDEPQGEIAVGHTRLDVVERMLLLRRVPLLRRAGMQALAALAEASNERVLRAGESLFARGKRRELHIVAAGQIEARRASPDIVGRFRSGAMVCDAEAFDDAGPFEAHATHPSSVISISLEDYFDVLEEKSTVARSALRAFAEESERLLNRS